jgi:hypothetical protein
MTHRPDLPDEILIQMSTLSFAGAAGPTSSKKQSKKVRLD